MASAAGVPVWATRRHPYLVPRGLPSPAWAEAAECGPQSCGRGGPRLPGSNLPFSEARSDHPIEACPPHPQPQPLCSLVQTRLSFVPTACLAHGVSWLTADTPGPLAEGMNEHTGA